MDTPESNSTCSLLRRPLRILIVDDNQDTAISLARLMSIAGHKTHLAFDGLTAISVADTFDPDVVLLDIGLPGMSGFDVCISIRSLPRGKDIAIFAVTGWGNTTDRIKSHDVGFDEHLVKPVRFEGLERLLNELGERHQSVESEGSTIGCRA
jgi:DNA-binding response OmpR family regulator